MSLTGIAFETTYEVALEAAYTYAEEFARAGHGRAHVLQVFRAPNYRGPYSAFQVLGLEKITEIIDECDSAMAACRNASRTFHVAACGVESVDNVCDLQICK